MRGRPPSHRNTWKIEITSPNRGISYDVRLLETGEMLVEGARNPSRAAVRILLADGRGHHSDRLEVYRPGQAHFAFHGLFREFASFQAKPEEPKETEARPVLPGVFMLLEAAE